MIQYIKFDLRIQCMVHCCNRRKPYFGQNLTFQSAGMTLKIRSRSPKSKQLILHSQQCIYKSFVKIHPLVQKITNGNQAMGTPTGSAPQQICPSLFGWGDINIACLCIFAYTLILIKSSRGCGPSFFSLANQVFSASVFYSIIVDQILILT